MWIQKVDVPLRAYTTVKTYYYSTNFTGELREIEFVPGTLCNSTTPVLSIYRNSSAIAANRIFKRGIPSTGDVWRPRYGLHLSTGLLVSSSNFGQPWNFADDRIRVILSETSGAGASRATLNFFIG